LDPDGGSTDRDLRDMAIGYEIEESK